MLALSFTSLGSILEVAALLLVMKAMDGTFFWLRLPGSGGPCGDDWSRFEIGLEDGD